LLNGVPFGIFPAFHGAIAKGYECCFTHTI